MDPRPTRRTSSGLSTDMVELALCTVWFRKGYNVAFANDGDFRKMDCIRGAAGDSLDSIYMC